MGFHWFGLEEIGCCKYFFKLDFQIYGFPLVWFGRDRMLQIFFLQILSGAI